MTNLPAISRPRMNGIKGLPVIMPERGKIKIGRKGEPRQSKSGGTWQPPIKLDHFIVTTTMRGPDGNFIRDEAIHKVIGDKPTRIPIRLLYDDPSLNFLTRYVAYKGTVMWCAGDGEVASRVKDGTDYREDVQCPCPRSQPGYAGPDKCKINGMLSAIVDNSATVGGVWRFRTTSFNTVTGIVASLGFLSSVTGGVLAGLPLDLVVGPKLASDPKGKQVTVYVVSLEYRGTMEELQERADQVALTRARAGLRIEHAEARARELLAIPNLTVPFEGDDVQDVVPEEYPEQIENAPPRPQREAEPASGNIDAETGEVLIGGDAVLDVLDEATQPTANPAGLGEGPSDSGGVAPPSPPADAPRPPKTAPVAIPRPMMPGGKVTDWAALSMAIQQAILDAESNAEINAIRAVNRVSLNDFATSNVISIRQHYDAIVATAKTRREQLAVQDGSVMQ